MTSKEVIADITLLGASVIWGGTFPLIKVALRYSSPFAFLALRFLVAASLLAVIFRKEIVSASWGTLKAGFLIGVFIFIGYVTQTVGLEYTTASKSGFITGLYIVFTPVLAYLILKTLLPKEQVFAVLLALLGLFLLSGIEITGLRMGYGDFLTLISAIAYAFSIVLISKFTKKYGSSIMATTQILTVWVLCTLLWVMIEPVSLPTSTIVWAAVLFTAVFGTSLAFLAQNFAQKYTSPTKAVIIFTAEPVFAFVFSFLLLGETLSYEGIAGAALIVSGMLLSEIRSRRD